MDRLQHTTNNTIGDTDSGSGKEVGENVTGKKDTFSYTVSLSHFCLFCFEAHIF